MEQADLLKESHRRDGPRMGPWSRGAFPWQGNVVSHCVCARVTLGADGTFQAVGREQS